MAVHGDPLAFVLCSGHGRAAAGLGDERPRRAAAVSGGAAPTSWCLRAVAPADTCWLVSLKEAALRPDLERLGVWDPLRSRHRLLVELAPASTWLVVLSGQPVGSIGLRSADGEQWLQHFFVLPEHQGRGLGSAVLGSLLGQRDDLRPLRLLALRGSRSLALYTRHGFSHERDHENGIDVVLVRSPAVRDRAVPA